MECAEDRILHDKEGSCIEEEVDDGHEFDDEQREAPEEVSQQSHPPPSPPLSIIICFKIQDGSWRLRRRTGIL